MVRLLSQKKDSGQKERKKTFSGGKGVPYRRLSTFFIIFEILPISSSSSAVKFSLSLTFLCFWHFCVMVVWNLFGSRFFCQWVTRLWKWDLFNRNVTFTLVNAPLLDFLVVGTCLSMAYRSALGRSWLSRQSICCL